MTPKSNKTLQKTDKELGIDTFGKIQHSKKELSNVTAELAEILNKLDVFNRALEKSIDGASTPYRDVDLLNTILKTTKVQQEELQAKYLGLVKYLDKLPEKLEGIERKKLSAVSKIIEA